ncbi:MAG: ATPase [Chloroflexota bacterium]
MRLLCLASYEKGAEFLREARRLGCDVVLVTVSSLEHAPWPFEFLDNFYVMPDLLDSENVCNGVSYLARDMVIDRIIALDDYDVPLAATLREHLRIPGMGTSLARHFRDKLAMRVRAREGNILVPDFVHLVNNSRIHDFTQRTPIPWVLKPRAEVSAIGITKIEDERSLWEQVEYLGDRRSHFLLEEYIPGEVYHVDSIVARAQVLFGEIHKYARPPMDVFHGGGIAMTAAVPRDSHDAQVLGRLNSDVLAVLGMENGVTHMEFIKGPDERFYFLEVGARVGGAHTAEMVEAATGINLWREWARLEVLGSEYSLPEHGRQYAGVIVSLAREEFPDTFAYTDPEIVYRVNKHHHVGFVLASETPERIAALQEEYSRRISDDFAASMPAWQERPPAE